VNTLAALVETAAATRARLVEEAATEADRRSGLTRARPAINILQASVRPVLEEARTPLVAAGVAMSRRKPWKQKLPLAGLNPDLQMINLPT
jgi:hypothetical protein